MIVRKRSPLTGKINEMDLPITQVQIDAYNMGVPIHDVFPHLTSDQREFILTGYTVEDWRTMFPLEEKYNGTEND